MTSYLGSVMESSGDGSSDRPGSDELALLMAVFNATNALLIVMDFSGRIQYWNNACEKLSGYTLAEVKETPYFDLFLPPDEPKPAPGSLEALFAGQSNFKQISPWVMKNGSKHWISWSNSVYQARLVISTGIDITDEHNSNNALEDNRIRERKILETLPVGIWVTDPSGKMILSNPEGERVWGGSNEFEIHPSDSVYGLEATADGWQTIRTQGPLHEIWSDDEVTFEETDGTHHIIQTQSIPLQDDHSQMLGSLMVSQDITQRKRIEEQLRQNENRARILAEITQALADVSLDYQAVLDTTIERVTELIGDLGTIQVLSDDRSEIMTVAVHHTDLYQRSLARQTFLSTHSPATAGIRSQVISSGLPVLIQEIGEDNLADEPAPENLPYLVGEHPANLLIVPLRVHAEAFGLLTLSRQQKGTVFSVDDLNFVLELAERAALAIENARLYTDNLRQREELEVRVAKRTAEISVINQYLQLQLRERARVEEELSLFFDVALDMLCIATFDGYLTRVSPTWTKVLGWSAEELTASSYLDLVHPDDREMTLKSTATLADGNVLIGLDSRYRCKDGSYRWMSWNSVGLPERGIIIAAARDITERKEAERRLAEVLELNQKIIANSPVGIFAYRPNGDCILANETSTRILGATQLQVMSQNFRQIGPWQRAGLVKLADKALEEGIDQHTEIHVVSSFNRETWLECFLTSFHRGEERHLLLMANDITSRKKVEDELQYMATHDALTGLPNRNLFQDRLDLAMARAYRYDQRLAVMLLDLDHFKLINDTYGHPIGDELLKVVGERLTECLRKSDTVARMGGDEFTFIFSDIINPEHVEIIAHKILTAINQPVELGGIVHHPTASLGISLYPQQGNEPDILLKKADIAMYASKQFRNRFTIYQGDD